MLSLPANVSWKDIFLMRGASPQRFDDFMSRSTKAALFAFVTAVAVSIFLWDFINHTILAGWLALVALTCAFQAYSAIVRRNRRLRRISRRTYVMSIVVTFIASLPWIALSLITVILVPQDLRGYVIIVIAGVSSGGMMLMAKIPPMAVTYNICANVPLIISSVFFDSFGSQTFSFNIACYTLLQIYHTYNTSRDELSREDASQRLLSQNLELEEARQQVDILAHTDPITGLPNRRAFQSQLTSAIKALNGRSQRPFGLALLDLDNFKTINDTFGHNTGDEYLAGVAERLVRICPPDAFIARLGGDEFAVIIPHLDSAVELAIIGDKIAAALLTPMQIGLTTLAEGGSVGLALAPLHAVTEDDLFTFADDALLNAKDKARGGFAVFDPVSKEKLLEREHEGRLLAESIRQGEILVHYQPQMWLNPHRLCGVEALVRWQHPTRGLLTPAVILPLAEECGLVLELCDAIMCRVAEDLRQWQALNLDVGSVAINLHPLQLKAPVRLLEQVDLLLKTTGSPDRIVLELTEECIIGRGTESVSKVLDELLARGIKLSLDDFGTGYASLVHLNDLPIHEIKIDRSFTNGVIDSVAKQTIIKAILDMASARSLHVVAEGIETKAQEAALLRLGCRCGQGYLYAKPVTFDAICDFVMMSPSTLPLLFAVNK